MKKITRYFITLSIGILMFSIGVITSYGQTCINLATPTTTTQNFDTLANSGTTNTTYPTGFAANATNGIDYRAGTGSDNAGDIYSFGAATTTERALGSLASGSTGTVTFGGCITNTSGASFGSIAIAYTGEQWREGNTTLDTLTFQYSTNATSITDAAATWVTVSALNFDSPVNGSNSGALNGNLPANQANLSSTISVVVPNTSSFYFRWQDANDSGSDNGMGIDNFALTALSPTAAGGTITGRALTSTGQGLKYVVVMLTGGNLSEPIYATTNNFGNYKFEDIAVGQTYVLQANSGRYTFENSSRLINLDDSITNADFIVSDPDGGNSNRGNNQKGNVLIQRNSTKKP